MAYVIGTAGHVDHGKSTLVEALTGIDPDRLAEEKERAMTIDLGFAWLTLPSDEAVGIVDVPGHRDFIENMLAGIGGIDLVLFIIAADEGVMPQTREHLAILDLLEIPGGIIALTKADLIDDPEWLDLVMLDVIEVVAGTVLEDAPIIPVSALDGRGLDDLLAALAEALSERAPRPDRGRPRLPIDRVFTISGFGTVVTGTLVDGALATGDEVAILPRDLPARVRGLQSHKDTIEIARPGSRVAVNLSGVDTTDILRGDVVTLPGLLAGSKLIDVRFRQLPEASRALRHNAEVKFFSGAAETVARVRLLGVRELLPGEEGWLQLDLVDALALDRGDRFILRYPSPTETIGGGDVLDPHPPYLWRRFKDEVIDRLETLAEGTPEDMLLQILEPVIAMSFGDAVAATALPEDGVRQAVELLEDSGLLIALPDSWLMAASAWMRTGDHIVQILSDYHHAQPLDTGMAREELRSRLRGRTEIIQSSDEDGDRGGHCRHRRHYREATRTHSAI